MSIDELRQQYLSKAPYSICDTITEGVFTADELAGIQRYGYWFQAIWDDQVPLATDKLKRFRNARKLNSLDRNKWEDLWVRYDLERCPF